MQPTVQEDSFDAMETMEIHIVALRIVEVARRYREGPYRRPPLQLQHPLLLPMFTATAEIPELVPQLAV